MLFALSLQICPFRPLGAVVRRRFSLDAGDRCDYLGEEQTQVGSDGVITSLGFALCNYFYQGHWWSLCCGSLQSHLMLIAAPREEPAKFADHKQISKHRTWYYSLLINRQIAKVPLIRRTEPAHRALLPYQLLKSKRCVATQQCVARPPDQIRM
jgi:hypothetical protein